MDFFTILLIVIVSIAVIIFLASCILTLIASSYSNKYAQKAKLLLENTNNEPRELLINPTLIPAEIKANKLVSFMLLNNSIKTEKPITVIAQLNPDRLKNKKTHFLRLYICYNDDIIYTEKIDKKDCDLIVKYFVLKNTNKNN